MRRSTAVFAFSAALAVLAGCVGTSLEDLAADVPAPSERRASAEAIAANAGMTGAVLPVSPFAIQSFRRGTGNALTVYIEGDGHAWLTQRRQSPDPTPLRPVALELAARDPSPAVAYLGRPCQYLSSPACAQRYWGEARFGDEVLAAMNAAISSIKREAGASRVHLVGYSGGGAVAALLAARRDDVASLRTVAGYLDHVRLNREVGVAPLRGSRDPMAVAPSLRIIPQLHVSGSADMVIPTWVAERFVEAQGIGSCATTLVIEGIGHQAGWAAAWSEIRSRSLPCAAD